MASSIRRRQIDGESRVPTVALSADPNLVYSLSGPAGQDPDYNTMHLVLGHELDMTEQAYGANG